MSKIGQIRLNLRYQPGASNIDDLQAEISSALEDIADPKSDLGQIASGIGISPGEFARATGSVDQEGKGFGDVIVLITIFAPAANHALRDVWDQVIWPRIKSRLGADAIGNEVEEDDTDRDETDGDTD